MTDQPRDLKAAVGFHMETTLCLDCGAVPAELGYAPISAREVERGLYQRVCDRCGKDLEPRKESSDDR